MVGDNTNGETELSLGMGAARRYVYKLTGHMPGLSTVHRWRLKNRLNAVLIGGRFFTTEGAIRRMLAADEQRNRASANSRGQAAADRIEVLTTRTRPATGGHL